MEFTAQDLILWGVAIGLLIFFRLSSSEDKPRNKKGTKPNKKRLPKSLKKLKGNKAKFQIIFFILITLFLLFDEEPKKRRSLSKSLEKTQEENRVRKTRRKKRKKNRRSLQYNRIKGYINTGKYSEGISAIYSLVNGTGGHYKQSTQLLDIAREGYLKTTEQKIKVEKMIGSGALDSFMLRLKSEYFKSAKKKEYARLHVIQSLFKKYLPEHKWTHEITSHYSEIEESIPRRDLGHLEIPI